MADVKPLKIDPAGPKVPERFETGDTVGVPHGGTGKNAINRGELLVGTTGNAFTTIGPGTSGQIVTSNGTDLYMADPPASGDIATAVNANAGTLAPGCPVYQKTTANQVDKARANAIGTSFVAGLTIASILTTATGTIRTTGPLTLTTGQWDAITGGSGGLTAGSVYYLDPGTAGLLTLSPTDSTGNFLVKVGIALSTTTLLIQIAEPIGL